MNLAIAAIGGLSGLLIAQGTYSLRNRLQLLHLGVYLVIGVFCLYPIYASRNIYSTIPRYQRWSSFWDERDSEIRLASQNKLVDVEVIKIDHIIPYVAELSEDPTFWYNACAADYYGVGSLRADLPGWDSP